MDNLEMGDIVCVEVQYEQLRFEYKDYGLGKVVRRTGAFIISSNIFRQSSLQKIVSDMCFRLRWKPLVYRRIPDDQWIPKSGSSRVLTAPILKGLF